MIRNLKKIILQVFLFLCVLEGLLRLGGALSVQLQKFLSGPIQLDRSHFRVLCVGDSISTDPYVNKLKEILDRGSYPFQIDVFNRSFAGATSKSALELMNKIMDEYQPHLVAAMVGLNDESMVKEEVVLPDFMVKEEQALPQKEGVGFANLPIQKIREYRDTFRWMEHHVHVFKMIQGMIQQLRIMERPWIIENMVTGVRMIKVYLKPEDPMQRLFLGLNLAKRGMYGQALTTLKGIVRFPKTLYERGDLIADTFIHHGQIEMASEWLEYALKHQERASFYLRLAECYKRQGRSERLPDIYQKAVKAARTDEILPVLLWSDYLMSQKQFKEAEKVLLDLVEKDQVAGKKQVGVYQYLRKCYLAEGEHAKAEHITNELKEINVAGRQYKRQLYELVKSHGAVLFAIQYPMLDVDELVREYDYVNDQIVYINNQQIFEEAIDQAGYYEIFYDMSGPKFGHFTDAGAAVLAANVAQEIQPYLAAYRQQF